MGCELLGSSLVEAITYLYVQPLGFVMDYRDKVLTVARNSPVVPTQIAKALATDSMMAGAMLSEMVSKGLVLSGISPSERLVEIIELKDHPWYVGVQFHTEFKSRPNRPHPLFRDFIRASLEYQKR